MRAELFETFKDVARREIVAFADGNKRGKVFMHRVCDILSQWLGAESGSITLERSPGKSDIKATEGILPFFIECKDDKRWEYRQFLGKCLDLDSTSGVMNKWLVQLFEDWSDNKGLLRIPVLVFTKPYEPIWALLPFYVVRDAPKFVPHGCIWFTLGSQTKALSMVNFELFLKSVTKEYCFSFGQGVRLLLLRQKIRKEFHRDEG